jgi:DNA primase
VPTARGLIRYEGQLEADIRIASLPKGKDPDDILKEGLDVWQAVIDSAVPVVDFYFQVVISELDLETAKGKSAVVRELIPVLRDISHPVEREHYIQKLARLIHVDERTLMAEVNSKRPTKRPRRQVITSTAPRPAEQQPTLPPEQVVTSAGRRETPGSKLEEYCLSLILTNPSALALANEILDEQKVPSLTIHDFKRGDNRELFRSIQLWTASQTPEMEVLASMVGESLEPHLANLASQWHNRPTVPFENVERDLSIAILRLRLQNLAEQINELTFLQQEMMDKGDLESARHYTEMVEQNKQQRRELELVRDALSLVGKRRLEANQFGAAI